MTWDEVVKQGYDQFLRRHEDLEYVTRCKDCECWQYDSVFKQGWCEGRERNAYDYCSRPMRKEVKDGR